MAWVTEDVETSPVAQPFSSAISSIDERRFPCASTPIAPFLVLTPVANAVPAAPESVM